jgi:hypothetical protein
MDEIDFDNYSTKPHPNKRLNPQNLIKRRGLIFGFSPRETTVSAAPKLPETTPSSPSLHLPVVSNSQHPRRYELLAMPICVEHGKAHTDSKRSKRSMG